MLSGSADASGTCDDSSALSRAVERLLVAPVPRARRVFLGVAILRPGGALLGEAERRVRRRIEADSAGGGNDAPLAAESDSFMTKRGGVEILLAGS